jgi:uncharacterized protein YvpB
MALTLVTGLALASPELGDLASDGSQRVDVPRRLELRSGQRVLVAVPVSRYVAAGRVDVDRLRRLLMRALPATVVARRRRARITYRYDVGDTAARVAALGAGGGRAQAVRESVAAVTRAPVVQQAQRNTCESAALAVLLATAGREVDQRRLQRAFPRSGSLDPQGVGPARRWGDPDRGFVGRTDGGGLAGGFGIYPRPVRATARRFGARLRDFSGRSPLLLYKRLLAGRAAMVWVGLSDGPYGRWRAPDGRMVSVNFGEHTVVVHGLRRDGRLLVSNPLRATRELWSKDTFETMWRRLGQRALTT